MDQSHRSLPSTVILKRMNAMKKKIIFFDGDGTLWYPKATKRTQKPHWVYHDALTKNAYLQHLELTPKAKETLEQLHEKGMLLVLISANPYAADIALPEIRERLEYFGLLGLFHSYYSSDGADPSGKAAVMLDVIRKLELTKMDALMVGDSYFYDYAAARDAGIEAFFINNTVSKMPRTAPADLQTIQEIHELLTIL